MKKMMNHPVRPYCQAFFLLLFFFAASCKRSVPDMAGDSVQRSVQATVTIAIDTSQVLLASKLQLGTTYMQYNLDSWGNTASINRGKALLQGNLVYHNQHIFAFGADNPEPRPGVFDWTSLDARINMMRSMSATPVITLATSPTWMVDPTWYPGKYGGDDTNWDTVEAAPLSQHVLDYASLCGKVASRYPDVKYFQVWNEMKGMWDDANNRWDYGRYTTLYNAVYDSVKYYRPDALIGGPYVSIDTYKNPPFGASSSITSTAYGTIDQRSLDVITYWLQHKKGADFLCLDASTDANDYTSYEVMAATKKYADLSTWLKLQTTLPIWWAEDYVGQQDTVKQPAALACMISWHALSGDRVSLRWSPESQDITSAKTNDCNFFTNTLNAGGGYPYANYYVYKNFNLYFPAGTNLVKTTVSDGNSIMVVASKAHRMIINKTGSTKSVSVNGGTVISLSPYKVYFN